MSRVFVYLLTILLCMFVVLGERVYAEDIDHLAGERIYSGDFSQESFERTDKKIEVLREQLTSPLAHQLPTVELAFQRAKRGSLKVSLEQVEKLADLLLEGKDPFEGKKGDFFKAYRSEVDSTLQPYRIFIPSSYGNGQHFPLLVALHGYQDREDAYFDEERYGKGEIKQYAEERGYLIVCPYGRGNSGYKELGENDVLRVIEEVRRDYKIDPDRIYMTGHSMGAEGTWLIGLKYPHLFAAIVPMAGRAPLDLIKNAQFLPVYLAHGAKDGQVDVQHSRDAYQLLKNLGSEVVYHELPNAGHYGFINEEFRAMFDWFDGHKKQNF